MHPPCATDLRRCPFGPKTENPALQVPLLVEGSLGRRAAAHLVVPVGLITWSFS